MGGASFKCPRCDKWFLHLSSLRDHLKGKHREKDLIISGTGDNVCVEPGQASLKKSRRAELCFKITSSPEVIVNQMTSESEEVKAGGIFDPGFDEKGAPF